MAKVSPETLKLPKFALNETIDLDYTNQLLLNPMHWNAYSSLLYLARLKKMCFQGFYKNKNSIYFKNDVLLFGMTFEGYWISNHNAYRSTFAHGLPGDAAGSPGHMEGGPVLEAPHIQATGHIPICLIIGLFLMNQSSKENESPFSHVSLTIKILAN